MFSILNKRIGDRSPDRGLEGRGGEQLEGDPKSGPRAAGRVQTVGRGRGGRT